MGKGIKAHLGVLGLPAVHCGFFLVFYNNIVNLIPPAMHTRLYVGLNVIVLLVVCSCAYKFWGFRMADAGIRRGGLWTSLGYGICLVAIIIIPLFIGLWMLPRIGVSLPAIRLDEMAQEGLVSRLLIRIPLGTAIFEEMLFRGIFLGLLLKELRPQGALLSSSLMFGVWHIVPALKVMFRNFGVSSVLPGTGMFILGILGAVIAGYFFGWVRIRTNNIIGPVIAHLLINDIALVAIYFLWKT
jgi:membrane protease YdiL (CAAX protease family)